MTRFKEVCEEAARAGGQILLEMRGRINPREKAPNDFVTEADLASQEAIRQIIARDFPEHGFLGEEGSAQPKQANSVAVSQFPEHCWVVDPLDGTLNYTRQLPNYSVSIALRYQDRVICGVVYDPVLDECFSAEAGGGATLNGQAIGTSSCVELNRALVAASLPAEVPRGSHEVDRFVAVMHEAQSIRRLGSAALNLCYVAMGRLDAYWATCVKIWDVAAGQLILTEAGGVLTRLDGTPFDLDRPQFVAAATERLNHELATLLQNAVGEQST